jgi:hypothetical protein
MKRFSVPLVALLSLEIVLFLALQAAKDPASAVAADQAAATIEKRIIDSPGVTLQAPFGKLALGSFHLAMKATQPRLDDGQKQVVVDDWRLTADLERDNASVVCNIKDPATGKAQAIRGWIIGEGRPGGVPYEMIGGKPDLSPRVQHQCWARSYAWTPALSVAASGHTAAGQETIDGRVADKYNVEARPKALDHIRPMMNLSSSKGTVWLDRQTGALLKAIIAYKENFAERRGSDKIVGTGDGHVDMVVTRVGKVTVELPK